MQILYWDLSDLKNFLVGNNFAIIKKQQQEHLIARSLELVPHLLPEVST